ncbi:MAG: NUDIX domain-containing protein [Candidatus Saccharibacteria bacterium]|nr:MAG: NUDIX domain-containing protein [Candidatus Saccharibacteria bacterium]
MNSIHKAGGIILKDRRLLVTRSFGKDIFIAPGGKLEANESPEQALKREMLEELAITIVPDTLEHIGTFHAEAAGRAGVQLRMDVYVINDYEGELSPSSEVEELMWINTRTTGVAIGSIFEHNVMPLLKQNNLID